MSDRAVRREFDRQAAAEREMARSVVQAIRTNPDLQWFFSNVLAMAGMGQSPFSSDPLQMAHDSGKLTLAYAMFHELERADPGIILFLQAQGNLRNEALSKRVADRVEEL